MDGLLAAPTSQDGGRRVVKYRLDPVGPKGWVPEIKLNLSQLVSIRIIFGLGSVGLVHSVMCSSNNQSERSLLKSAERGREAADMRTAFRLERERERERAECVCS